MASIQKGFLDSISPWPSRSTTPKPGQATNDASKTSGLEQSQGADHTVTHRHRLSRKDYPFDCPKTNIRWFYAVDVCISVSYFTCILAQANGLVLTHEARCPSGSLGL